MLTKIIKWKCESCGKVYQENPVHCECENRLLSGKIIGPFKLLKKEDDNNWGVNCLICGLDKTVHQSNIKRQKSCGCKPPWVNINTISNTHVRYYCKKCGNNVVQSLPVDEFCCDSEE